MFIQYNNKYMSAQICIKVIKTSDRVNICFEQCNSLLSCTIWNKSYFLCLNYPNRSNYLNCKLVWTYSVRYLRLNKVVEMTLERTSSVPSRLR